MSHLARSDRRTFLNRLWRRRQQRRLLSLVSNRICQHTAERTSGSAALDWVAWVEGMRTGIGSYGDILALCDVDEKQAKKAMTTPILGAGSDLYGDYRKVLERADIDVVSIVTPDHWHVKMPSKRCRLANMFSVTTPLTLNLERTS